MFTPARKISGRMDAAMKTYTAKPGEIDKSWLLIDAEGLVLGRLAALVATRLRGKHKPTYTPHMDCGDNVIIINAEKVHLTGNKMTNKVYYRHTGYPGGIKEIRARDLLKKHPNRLITFAVKGMLPKNKLGRQMLKKLKVYAGADHPHQAQQPDPLSL